MRVRESFEPQRLLFVSSEPSAAEHLPSMEPQQLPEMVPDSSFGMFRHPLWSTTVFIVAYLLLFCVGFAGNVAVIYIIFRTPRMQTKTNLYIASLAAADLLIVLICIPSTLVSNIYVPWVMGWFLCKTVPYVQGVSVCASVYSLVAISVDRFLAVWFPLRSQVSRCVTRLTICGIWVFAAVVMLPWALFFNISKNVPEHPEIAFCLELWPEGLNSRLYFVVGNLLICYLLPLTLVSACYFFIWLRVWRRYIPSDADSFSSAQLSHMELIHQRSKVSVLKTVLVVVLVFAISWLPLYSIFTILKLGPRLSPAEEEVFALLAPIAQWLGSSNSCLNPVLYGFLNVKFRRVFLSICKRQQVPPQPQSHTPLFKARIYRNRTYLANSSL